MTHQDVKLNRTINPNVLLVMPLFLCCDLPSGNCAGLHRGGIFQTKREDLTSQHLLFLLTTHLSTFHLPTLLTLCINVLRFLDALLISTRHPSPGGREIHANGRTRFPGRKTFSDFFSLCNRSPNMPSADLVSKAYG